MVVFLWLVASVGVMFIVLIAFQYFLGEMKYRPIEEKICFIGLTTCMVLFFSVLLLRCLQKKGTIVRHRSKANYL